MMENNSHKNRKLEYDILSFEGSCVCIDVGDDILDLTDVDLSDNSFSKDETTDLPNNNEQVSCFGQFLNEIKNWCQAQPLYIVICALSLGVAIIVTGAIIFFVLIGATPYYSTKVNDQLVEISSQVLNAIFTLLCALIAPNRALSCYHYFYLKLGFTKEKANFEHDLLHSFPWAAEASNNSEIDKNKLTTMGFLIVFQNMHCCCQWVVASFMWRYGQKSRPPISMLFVGLAIVLGCGTGVSECRLKEKYKQVQNS